MRDDDFYALEPFFDMVDGVQSLLPLRIRNYLEIGVNRALSLRRVLRRYPDIERVVLCDSWSYETSSREFVEGVIIDESFPLDRVTFLEGKSARQIPKFFRENPGIFFDVAYVDGGHSPQCLRADLRNVDTHARIIVVHDIRYVKKLRPVMDRFFELHRNRFWKLTTETDKWGTAVLIDSTRLEGST